MLEFKYIWGCGSTDWWVRDGFPKSSFDGNRRSTWWQGWAWVMREKRVMRIYHINYGQQEWGLWTIENMIRGHWSGQGSLGWLSFKSWYTLSGKKGREVRDLSWSVSIGGTTSDGLSRCGCRLWMVWADDRDRVRKYEWQKLMTGRIGGNLSDDW